MLEGGARLHGWLPLFVCQQIDTAALQDERVSKRWLFTSGENSEQIQGATGFKPKTLYDPDNRYNSTASIALIAFFTVRRRGIQLLFA